MTFPTCLHGGLLSLAHRFRELSVLLPLACVLILAGCSGAEREADRALDEAKRKAGSIVSDQTDGTGGVSGQTSVHTVSGIADGDTIEVSPAAAGGTRDVRFLAVDTPETHDGPEPLGPEAKAFTTRQLEGEKVRLEYDKDRIDPYNRALAFVTVVGEERTIQAQLLSKGYAQTAFFQPNNLYREKLEAIQADARQRNAGIWGLPVSQRCELADRSNGIGEGSAECR